MAIHNSLDVVGLGVVGVDHLLVLPRFPEADGKIDALETHVQIGGPVPTALVVLSRFGRKCGFLGSWGDDGDGQRIAADLSREEIDLAGAVCRRGAHTGFSQIWIDRERGTRTIACYRIRHPLSPDELHRPSLAGCGILHLDGWPGDAALEAARIVRQRGGRVVLDAGSWKPGMDQLLPLVDVVNCSGRFVADFARPHEAAESTAARLLDSGPRLVTMTQGERGATLYTAAETFRAVPPTIAAVDTTGAGDVFCGALIYGLGEGWAPDVLLQFAVTASALKCAGLGNRDALRTLVEINEACRESGRTDRG